MRKSIILLVVLALLAGFGLMSCKNEVATQDTLSEVCISLSESRNMIGTVTSSIPPVSDLYWYYVATKNDKGLYATGATPWKAVQEEKGLTEGTLLGLFSQGKWKFSFYGFKEADIPSVANPAVGPTETQLEKAVYYAKNMLVTVNNARANVNITLTAGDILNGKVVLDDLKFNLEHVNSDVQLNAGAEGSFVLHVKYSDNEDNHDIASKPVDYVSGTKEYSFILPVGEVDNETVYESTKTIADIADGTYTYTFEVVFTDTGDTPNSIVVATEDVGVTISKGTIVTFRGDVFYSDPVDEVVIGEITGEKQATASFTVSSGKAITVSANVTPASVDSGSATTTTTVEFPKDSLKSTVMDEDTGNTTSYDHDLKVEVAVKNVTATSETFVIGNTETPVAQLPANTVAGIDLTLTQKTTVTDSDNVVVGTPVVEELHSFEDNAVVTVSTYIATGLLNVDVYYNGLNYFNNNGVNTPYLESYDAATGLLKFKTNHFSEFWVVGIAPVEQCNHPNLAGTFCLDCQHPVAFVEELLLNNLNISNEEMAEIPYLLLSETKNDYGKYFISDYSKVSMQVSNFDPDFLTLYLFAAYPEDGFSFKNDPNDDVNLYVVDRESNNRVRKAEENDEGDRLTEYAIYDLFDDWACDYYISFDGAITYNSCCLLGAYGDMAFAIGLPALTAGEENPLLGSVLPGDYDYGYICNTVKNFICGFYNMDPANAGKTLSVILRMTSPDGKTSIDVCRVDYVIPSSSSTTGDMEGESMT